MHPLLKKLNVKEQTTLYVINSPSTFNDTIKEWEKDDKQVLQSLPQEGHLPFILCFVLDQETLDQMIKQLSPYIEKTQEALLWFAYPKKSSKTYKSNINRDHGWQGLGNLGYEPVRQIAIDEDWSALRFRPVENIASLTRNSEMAISEKGRQLTSSNNKKSGGK